MNIRIGIYVNGETAHFKSERQIVGDELVYAHMPEHVLRANFERVLGTMLQEENVLPELLQFLQDEKELADAKKRQEEASANVRAIKNRVNRRGT